jgi:hypothetical protein
MNFISSVSAITSSSACRMDQRPGTHGLSPPAAKLGALLEDRGAGGSDVERLGLVVLLSTHSRRVLGL